VSARLKLDDAPAAERDRSALRLVVPSAYDKYLQAREALATDDASRAVQLFEAAAAEDPSLIEAQAGLAEALYTMSAFEGRQLFSVVRERARRAAESAFATDPDLAATRLAMALTAPTLREALEQLRRALETDRSFTAAYLALADALRTVDPETSAGFARRAIELDPRSRLPTTGSPPRPLAAGDLDGTLARWIEGRRSPRRSHRWEGFKDRVAWCARRCATRDPRWRFATRATSLPASSSEQPC